MNLASLAVTGGALNTSSSQVDVAQFSSEVEGAGTPGSLIINSGGGVELQGGSGPFASVQNGSSGMLDYRAPGGILRIGTLIIDGRIESFTPVNFAACGAKGA